MGIGASGKARAVRRGRPLSEESQAASKVVASMHEKGASLRRIANRLTEEGYKTPSGKTKWYPSQVSAILKSVQIDRAIAARQRILNYGAAALRVPSASEQLVRSLEHLDQIHTILQQGTRASHRVVESIVGDKYTLDEYADYLANSIPTADKDVQQAERDVQQALLRIQETHEAGQKAEQAAQEAAYEGQKAQQSAQEAEQAAQEAAYEGQKAAGRAREAQTEFQSAELYLLKALRETAKLSFTPSQQSSQLEPAYAEQIAVAAEIQRVAAMTVEAAINTQQAARVKDIRETAAVARSRAEMARSRAEMATSRASTTKAMAELARSRVATTKAMAEIAKAMAEIANEKMRMSTERKRIATELADGVAAIVGLTGEFDLVTNATVERLKAARMETRESHRALTHLSEYLQDSPVPRDVR